MTDEVAAFYDEFTTGTMVRYRIVGNARIDAAIELVLPFVKPRAVVADIGCGIGIVSEAIARHERTARVIGLDLSPNNIRFAEATVDEPNVQFVVSSVTEQFEALTKVSGGPVDVICMIDVIEHIPVKDRARLFEDVAGVAADDAVFILTYPSPEFQRFRTEHDPAILQIIDNVIEFDDLYREFRTAGWHLASMQYRAIWYEHEYVHLVLRRKVPDEFRPVVPHLLRRAAKRLDQVILGSFRRWKYGKRAESIGRRT